MSSRSKHKAIIREHNIVKTQPPSIEDGMKRIKELDAAVKKGWDKGYSEGYETGRAKATEFASYAMCAAVGLALNELFGFGKKRVTRTLNLAGKYMFESFTTREIMEEVYKRIGFEFADDPVSSDLVEEID